MLLGYCAPPLWFRTRTDSIYGARHLAAKMARTQIPGHRLTELEAIEAFVLLDLIGAAQPVFRMPTVSPLPSVHRLLVDTETALSTQRLLPKHDPYFRLEMHRYGRLEDDHVPFQTRGVPVEHVIPLPFPETWHTAQDDREHLDWPTIHSLRKVFVAFALSYLGAVVNVP